MARATNIIILFRKISVSWPENCVFGLSSAERFAHKCGPIPMASSTSLTVHLNCHDDVTHGTSTRSGLLLPPHFPLKSKLVLYFYLSITFLIGRRGESSIPTTGRKMGVRIGHRVITGPSFNVFSSLLIPQPPIPTTLALPGGPNRLPVGGMPSCQSCQVAVSNISGLPRPPLSRR